MSLASDYTRSLSDTSLRPTSSVGSDRPARWTKMRSAIGTPISPTGERKLVYSRSQSDDYPMSPEVNAFGPSRTQIASESKKRAGAVQNAEVRRILDAVGNSIKAQYHSLHKGLRDIPCDGHGNLRKADLRRFFADHHVPARMADRVFNHMMADSRGSTLSLDGFKRTFNEYLGDHLMRQDSHDGSQASHHHHHHHNVHGLLRPRHSLASHCSVVNADTKHKEFTKEKLAKIAKQMTSNQQSRYIDKYGNINRQEIQHMFESYGLTPEQGNELFDAIDTGRTGEIKFKQLHAQLAPFLHVEVEKRKAPRGHGQPLSDDMLNAVCAHIGDKAAAKHKSLRGAFRFVDRDFDAQVDRYEVRNFFRVYGTKTEIADRFFDRLDVNRKGQIDFHKFKELFAPYIEPGYHPPVAGERQKTNEKVAWGDSHYGNQNCGKGVSNNLHASSAAMQRHITRTPRSARSSASSVSANMGEDELHATKYGRFQGVSTYTASYNPWVHHGIR